MTLRSHGTRQISTDEAFGTIRDASNRQWPARLKHICRRTRHA
jgi:hypothetical protein